MGVKDGGGALLTRARIVLIFRGSGWANGVPSVDDAKNVLTAVLASPYPSHLTQYRDIRRPRIVDTIVDMSDFGNLGPDPRGFITDADVWRVSDTDFQGAVRSAFAQDPPGEGEDTYYFVLFSRDPLPVFSDKAHLNDEGYHSQFDDDGRMITYGTLLNWSANTADNIWNSAGSLPEVFTHEVVEACTDPANGFRLDSGQELADLNDVRSVQLPGIPQPISLAAYWSELAGVAVVPTSYSLRIAFGLSRSASQFFEGPLSSMREAVLERVNP